jgi:hypothetical protein
MTAMVFFAMCAPCRRLTKFKPGIGAFGGDRIIVLEISAAISSTVKGPTCVTSGEGCGSGWKRRLLANLSQIVTHDRITCQNQLILTIGPRATFGRTGNQHGGNMHDMGLNVACERARISWSSQQACDGEYCL